jgi:hypothetical protein
MIDILKSLTVLTTVITSAILMTGCDFLKSEVEVKGQVFIVTKGRGNIHLGLVKVTAYKANQFIAAAEAKAASERSARAEIKTRLASLEAKTKAAREERDASEAIWGKTFSDKDWAKAEAARNNWRKNYFDEAKVKLELNALTEPSSFDNPKVEFSQSTKTDGNGNFKMNLKEGQYVLVAKASRSISSTDEVYTWFVKVKVDDKNNMFLLSNDNMLEQPGCISCLDFEEIIKRSDTKTN